MFLISFIIFWKKIQNAKTHLDVLRQNFSTTTTTASQDSLIVLYLYIMLYLVHADWFYAVKQTL